MKRIKLLLTVSFMAFVVLGMMSSASAITIDPFTSENWSGKVPGNPDATDIPGIVGYAGTLEELWKYDAYTTEITWDSTGDALYLLVKDGQGTNINPWWYIFNLTNLTLNMSYPDNSGLLNPYSWDGTADIQLAGFWPESGAISHVSIYGDSTPVPEPATMLLLGTGLIGLVGIGRRKFKKE